MRIVFAGSPAAAVPTLERLAERHDIAAVVTRAPSPVGRRRTMVSTAVGEAAERLGLRVIEADRLGDDETSEIARLQPDLGVIVAYGGLVREPLLSTPTAGWINLHFSLLPAYRGAAPVQRAIINGDANTGISVFQLVAELDAGPLYSSIDVPIPDRATAGDLLADLAVVGAKLVSEVVDDIGGGAAVPTPQQGTPTFAPKLDASDGVLDFASNADVVFSRFRGVTPEPGAHGTIDGQRVNVLGLDRIGDVAAITTATHPEPGSCVLIAKSAIVGTGSEPLMLETVQPAGKRPMLAADWLRGRGGTAQFDAVQAGAAQVSPEHG